MNRLRFAVHLDDEWNLRALRADVAEGLTSTPKRLPAKWFYDERGSQLFDEITRLPEYYPFVRERDILLREAGVIASRSGAAALVELGSGTSDKTRALLDAMTATGQLRCFVPFDVSEEILRESAAAIAADYPVIDVVGVVGDFEHHIDQIPVTGRRLVVFLGSTIGNSGPAERHELLTSLAAGLHPGDSLLLGTDLVKGVDRLVAAYDDSQGVTAEFNLNVLAVINRELQADFDVAGFEHIARYDAANEWMEMLVRAVHAQRVCVADLDLVVDFEAGELMRTEISAKFRRAGVFAELVAAGLEPAEWWTDDQGDFGVSLSFVPEPGEPGSRQHQG